MENEDFQALGIFDRIRLAAQLERVDRKRNYVSDVSLSGFGNRKTRSIIIGPDGRKFVVIPGDTIRGCDQFCHDCYALKGAQQGAISHQTPIRANLSGTLKSNHILRIGTVGEPAKDWAHTHNEVNGNIGTQPG